MGVYDARFRSVRMRECFGGKMFVASNVGQVAGGEDFLS